MPVDLTFKSNSRQNIWAKISQNILQANQSSGEINNFSRQHFIRILTTNYNQDDFYQQGESCWYQKYDFCCQSKNKTSGNIYKITIWSFRCGGGPWVSALRHYGHCAGLVSFKYPWKVRVIFWCLYVLNSSRSEPDQTRKIFQNMQSQN